MVEATRRAALLALAERVEQASEGSAELDADIVWEIVCDEDRKVFDGVRHLVAMVGPQGPWFLPLADRAQDAPDYSRSLDAALSLKPAGWVLTVLGEGYHGGDQMVIEGGICELTDCERTVRAQAATPALALTAAALRARAAMEE